ncbi:unnamed protein product [Linum tenue]|uniref:CCR4-NOT transcription complex subunit 11 n=1 Tax=Linum tenue TaxID=586396 RepID=A0AAV0R809_9ROSI|nr:unnamed protein product [Linum tenue]
MGEIRMLSLETSMTNLVIDQDQQWLLNCLSATLDPNPELRNFAETSLNQASLQPGFPSLPLTFFASFFILSRRDRVLNSAEYGTQNLQLAGHFAAFYNWDSFCRCCYDLLLQCV